MGGGTGEMSGANCVMDFEVETEFRGLLIRLAKD
jgi:hypothetical protein